MASNVARAIGKINVASAGTPVRLTSTLSDPSAAVKCNTIMIEADPLNSGKVYVMDRSNGVKATRVGVLVILAVPATNIIPSFSVGSPAANNSLNLADFYVDADNNGEGVLVSILEM